MTHERNAWLVAGLGVAVMVIGAATIGGQAALLGLLVFVGGLAWAILQQGAGDPNKSTEGNRRKPIPAGVRRKIYKRARGRCQYPGCTVTDRGILDIHHVDMDPSNSLDEENLMAVCANHHRKIHDDADISIRQVRQWMRGQYGRRT
jgi:hypothetical protein